MSNIHIQIHIHIFPKKYTNGQQINEKILNITNHWGNIHQN